MNDFNQDHSPESRRERTRMPELARLEADNARLGRELARLRTELRWWRNEANRRAFTDAMAGIRKDENKRLREQLERCRDFELCWGMEELISENKRLREALEAK